MTICGEESAGTGSDHVREKDGLWAVLLWLNILAARKEPVADILRAHWAKYGRDYYSRHDFEAIESEKAQALMDRLIAALPNLPGQSAAGLSVKSAENFAYTDPIDGSESVGQGIILTFTTNARAMLRLSGTGTEGATLRVYLEQYAAPDQRHDTDAQTALEHVIKATMSLARVEHFTGRSAPDVIS